MDRYTVEKVDKTKPDQVLNKVETQDRPWISRMGLWITVAGKPDQNLLISKVEFRKEKVNFNGEQQEKTIVKFILTSGQLIHYKLNKKIYLKQRDKFRSDSYDDFNFDRKAVQSLKIVKSEDSDYKEKLFDLKKFDKTEPQKEQPIDTIEQKSNSAGAVIATTFLVTAAVFLRYFVIVDIIINSFSKINVELGPRIGTLVNFLRNLEFPSFGFTEKTSPIDDGGNQAIEDHEKYLENKKKSQDTAKQQDDNEERNSVEKNRARLIL